MAEPVLHAPPPPGHPKPKGILKNAPPPITTNPSHLKWDEENIAATDLSGETFMKISEPKTPYVRYNAELDEVEGMSNIPDFSLTQRSPAPSIHASPSPRRTPSTSPHPHTRRPSASAGPGGAAPTTGSTGSSRSASFSLPGEEGVVVLPGGGAPASAEEEGRQWGEVDEEEEMDEEAMRKHEEFVKARGRHYSNEAEAMRMARELLEEEEEEEKDGEGEDDLEEVVAPVPVHAHAPGLPAAHEEGGLGLTNGAPYGSAS